MFGRKLIVFYLINAVAVTAFQTKFSSASCKSTSIQATTNYVQSEVLENVILFDGVCNFCNGWVDLLLDVDTTKKFKFCALQSPKGRSILKQIGKDEDDISSVVYVKSIIDKEVYFKSNAALKVAEELGSAYAILSFMGRTLVPFPFIRDSIYDMVATNRYKLMGKRDVCRCADESFRDRFLS